MRKSINFIDKLIPLYNTLLVYNNFFFVLSTSYAKNVSLSITKIYVKCIKFQFYNDATTNKLQFSCQHGPSECQLNMLHACILDEVPFDIAFPIIACLMAGPNTNLEQVSKFLSNVYMILDFNKVVVCLLYLNFFFNTPYVDRKNE